jgi:hypothetical protein
MSASKLLLVLKPGIALFDRLVFVKKFVLIALCVSAPLAYVVYA